MKLALLLLVVLPFVFCAPEKRFILNDLGSPFDTHYISDLVNALFGAIGSDASEATCEGHCKNISTNALLDTACPFVCKSFQAMVQTYVHH